MEGIFDYLAGNSRGIFVFIFLLMATLFFMQWLAWIFCWGRFRSVQTEGTVKIRFYLARMIAGLFDDFRHFLALIIVLIFGLSLLSAFISSMGNIKEFSSSIQVVASSLGGLVAAIIGYYFGESAGMAKEKKNTESPPINTGEELQEVVGVNIDPVILSDQVAEVDLNDSAHNKPENNPNK